MAPTAKSVQTFGRKRNAVAVTLAKEGKGVIRLNGQPLHLVEPSIMRIKAIEPILLLGRERFATVDVRVRVKGGGQSAQIYAIRQSIAKALVAYAQKCAWREREGTGGRAGGARAGGGGGGGRGRTSARERGNGLGGPAQRNPFPAPR